jgi:trigger factor
VKISFHKKNATEASILIKIEEADYQARVAKRIKEYGKKASIKGFRPGNVPSALLQQMYGRSILMEEVNAMLTESLAQYLKENAIHVLGEPMPVREKIEAIDWEHQRDFELEYRIGMAGEFACELSKDIVVTAYKISHVAEQTVDDLVEQLRKTYGRVEVVTKSATDDVIHGALRYPAQNFKTQTEISVGAVAEKARKIFTDLSPKDEITFDVQQVFEKAAKFPGVTAKMYETMLRLGGSATLTVEKIHRLSPAVVEQEFFDKVLRPEVASSEQDFKQKLQVRILQNKQQEADFFLEQSIQAILLKKTAMALPDDFLKDWLQEKNNTVPKEQIEMYYQQYAKELQWHLLVAVLSKEHSLQVTHEEVADEVQHRLQATFNSTEVVEQLPENNMAQLIQNFLQKNHGKNYRKVHESVHARKLINFIKDQIKMVTQEVSVEEFDNLALE